MENLKNRISKIMNRLRGLDKSNVIIVNEYDGETREQAIKRYKKNGEYAVSDLPEIFVHVRSGEQIRRRQNNDTD
ncbi:MAG: hypothetical protein HND39_15020 [Ignavibacteriota bacterium]|jgi:methyl coenzyme M reductase alpha subunit|nr:hypothetical protein [Ignavibacteriales bacterium]MBL1123518.1 hypothetical protein [Ignavibacteriota bacterium]MCC7094621.1 hypothetical protein [Ignavibacteriaceae bacterium]MCE7856927.1 hypothetical protein [Ignavibacteria bacterium CHB3]MEB2296241.1 hypothetical protein [Ignavibacteria bacterium]